MRRKILLLLFLIVLIFAMFYKSPFSAMYNYNKGKDLYLNREYEKAIPYFKKALFADNKGILIRFYYAMTLSKVKPTYSVQATLYNLSNDKLNDEATQAAKIQSSYMKYNLTSDLADNYIYNATSGNDIIRWNIKSFPLKVFIENQNSVPDYYVENIKQALHKWASNTNFVKFTMTDKKELSQIIVRFIPINTTCQNYNNCKFVVAYTEPEISSKNNTLKKMTLTFYKTNPLNKNFTPTEIYNTALHEIGHTLGIMGHSDNSNDAMYSIQNLKTSSGFYKSSEYSLTKRDLNTLALLYRLKPTISDTPNLQSENFYYPPLIIGNNDLLLQKKLSEYLKYIKDYPNMASGYINISAVYSEMGNFDLALSALNKAETLSTTEDERYLTYYNRAILYFNIQESTHIRHSL